MNTKALCLTTLALLCSGTVNAQVSQTGFSQCGTACGASCCDSGCNDVCNSSIYNCQDWAGGDCCNNGKRFKLGLTRCNSCPGGVGVNKCSCLTKGCVSRHCAGKAFPDAGWAPPVRYPVNRNGVWYQNWLPQTAYGSPGGGFIGAYPQVYAPNDTTQMGYYYSKVPTWQTQTNRIPSAPRPSAFHRRMCLGACGPCGYRGGYGGQCYGYGHGQHGAVYYNSGCPSGNCQASAGVPVLQPVPAQSAPSPAPAVASAPAEAQSQVRTVSARKKNVFSLKRLKYLFD